MQDHVSLFVVGYLNVESILNCVICPFKILIVQAFGMNQILHYLSKSSATKAQNVFPKFEIRNTGFCGASTVCWFSR